MENDAKMDELLAQIKLLVGKMDTSLQNERLISDRLSGPSRASSREEAEKGRRESVRSRGKYNEEEEEEEEGGLGIGKGCFPSPKKLLKGLKCCGMTGGEEEEE